MLREEVIVFQDKEIPIADRVEDPSSFQFFVTYGHLDMFLTRTRHDTPRYAPHKNKTGYTYM